MAVLRSAICRPCERKVTVAILTLIASLSVSAASSDAASKRRGAIYVMNADGSGNHVLRNLKPITSHTPKGKGEPYTEIAVSPDGKKLAFNLATNPLLDDLSDRAASQEIYVMNSDGSHLRRITNDKLEDASPAWSPDSRKIVWHKVTEHIGDIGEPPATSPVGELFTANSDGSGLTQLTDNHLSGGDFNPAWSPDGQQILLQHQAVLSTVGPNGGPVTKVPIPDTDGRKGVWSPKGEKIAFLNGSVLKVVNPDGTGEQELPLLSGEVAWSPDGKRLAAPSGERCDHGLSNDIYTISVGGTGLANATGNICRRPHRRATGPVWINDNEVVFSFGPQGNQKSAQEFEKHFHIYKARFDGSHLTRLTKGKRDHVAPAVSPDGRKIYYVKAVREL